MGLKLEVGKFYKTRYGRKVGPMRSKYRHGGYHFDACGWDNSDRYCGTSQFYRADGTADDGREYDLIDEWTEDPTGPVRTVTRKEIVFGVHGDVEIVEDDTHQGGIGIYINATMNASRIRAAANNMLAVADAMEDQA